MSEGSAEGTARRGRRQPSIADAIELDQSMAVEQEGPEPQEPVLMFPGAVFGAKISSNFQINGQDTYVTVNASDHLQPGEDDEDLYVRVGSVVVTRLVDLAFEAEAKIAEAQQAFNTRRIRPRN